MTTLYKTRDMKLPTVVFHEDTFYEFLRTEPNYFEFETEDQYAVELLTGMGFLVKGGNPVKRADDSYPAVAAPPEPPDDELPRTPAVPKKAK